LGGNIEPALRKEDAYFKLIADDGENNMFTSGGDLFVHPGMSLQVFSFEFDVVRQSDAGFLRKHRAHDTRAPRKNSVAERCVRVIRLT
jgi:hypothetical protein